MTTLAQLERLGLGARGAVVSVPPINVFPPMISGDATVGALLTVIGGDYNPPATSLAYQWKRDGSAIEGATQPGYTLVSADTDALITVTETPSNAVGAGASVTSTAIGPVVQPSPLIPLTQTITWGALTRTGHGASLVGYTGSDELEIFTQKDASNATVTIWQMSQNALSWKGSVATYGQAPPATLNGPYTVVVREKNNHSVATTITINILANAAHIREMAAAAQGGRWATDSMYTVDGATSTSAVFQLRVVVPILMALTGSPTIWCRDGTFDPACVGLRIRPPATINCTLLTIRSETVDVGVDVDGYTPRRQHGFKFGGGCVWDSGSSGDIYYPILVRDVWLEPQVATGAVAPSVSCARYSAKGWGVCYSNCRANPGAGVISTYAADSSGIQIRGSQAQVAYAEYCTVTRLGKGLVLQSSTAGGRAKNAAVRFCDGFDMFEDFINDGATEAAIIEDNFNRDWLTDPVVGTGSHHPDFYQHIDSVSTATDGPLIRRNVCALNMDIAGHWPQGLFANDSGSRILTNSVMEHNIISTQHVNGIYLNKFNGPTIRGNTVICSASGSVPNGAGADGSPLALTALKVPSDGPGVGGTFTHNAVRSVQVSSQTGSVTSAPNYEFPTQATGALILAEYQAAFTAYVETGIYTREQARAAVTPVQDGALKNVADSTYNGALLPNGAYNTFAPYP